MAKSNQVKERALLDGVWPQHQGGRIAIRIPHLNSITPMFYRLSYLARRELTSRENNLKNDWENKDREKQDDEEKCIRETKLINYA